MKWLVVMQGAPGSGKSTIAAEIAQKLDAIVCSTDSEMYENDVYVFRVEKLGPAHEATFQRAKSAMEGGHNVILDNTNIRVWEPKRYIQEAVRLGYAVCFQRCVGRWDSVHGVPVEKIEQMRRDMEQLSTAGCLAALAPWEKGKVRGGAS